MPQGPKMETPSEAVMRVAKAMQQGFEEGFAAPAKSIEEAGAAVMTALASLSTGTMGQCGALSPLRRNRFGDPYQDVCDRESGHAEPLHRNDLSDTPPWEGDHGEIGRP